MSEQQLERVRRICLALPETSERLSHGEPTFFVHKKVFVMFAGNHHNDGRIAVWLPVPPDVQTMLIESSPQTYFRPPYVGVRGWVGIELDRIGDEDLAYHIRVAWELIAPRRLLA
ncbi:MAG TPA: MmcQ/YjbR family DNA-binding protein [Promineifilum sp.]|nr:MmcQ/YjbR family DNA-binding protein [Promineifilum sp.]